MSWPIQGQHMQTQDIHTDTEAAAALLEQRVRGSLVGVALRVGRRSGLFTSLGSLRL